MLRERHGTPPRSSTAGPDGPARPSQPNGCVSTSLRAGQRVGKRDVGPAVPIFGDHTYGRLSPHQSLAHKPSSKVTSSSHDLTSREAQPRVGRAAGADWP